MAVTRPRVHGINTRVTSSLRLAYVCEKLGAISVALAVLVALLTRRGFRTTIALALLTLAAFAADAISFGVKDAVHRTRPFVSLPQIHPLYVVHSSSFPAGHAATAFAGATLLSYLWPRGTPLFLVLASAIGFSRVYVGVHYPTDVIAGAIIGALTGLAAVGLLAAIRRSRREPTGKRIHAAFH